MSLILGVLGVLFLVAARCFSSLAASGSLSAQGLAVARMVHIPFLVVGGLSLVLAPLMIERSPLRRRLRAWLPPESQLLLPGLIALGLMQSIFVLTKLGEYSRVLVSREQFWDNYLLLGRFPVRIPSEPITLADYLNSTLLLVAGVTALLARGLLGAFAPEPSPQAYSARERENRIFYALLGLGFVYLALDEMLMFHEFIGANLRFDDGRIILGYLGLMALTCLLFRRKLLSRPVAAACLVVGGLFQGLGAVADRFHFWEQAFTPEEVAEMSASGFYLLAVLQYAYHDLCDMIESKK
jgi:hypothetical protein